MNKENSEQRFYLLGEEYKRSTELLNIRINEIEKEIIKLESELNKKNRKKIICEIEKLKDRLKPLIQMHREIKEISEEIFHYYDKWWWGNEKYTLNRRKSRLPVFYYGYIEYEEHEQETNSDDERGNS